MMGAQQRTPASPITFTYCKNFATAETKSATWDQFAATVAKSVPYGSKEESIKRAAIVGGVRSDESVGRADNVKSRTILTLDYDDFADLTIDDISFALELNMPDGAWVAYTTFRHTPAAPRVRIMAPLSRPVGAAEYAAVVDAVAATLGIGKPDPCSKKINQIMFLGSHRHGVEPWNATGGTGVLDVDALGLVFSGAEQEAEGGVFDLDMAVSAEPLDLTTDEVATLLDNHPACALDYDGWSRVGMGLHHQFRGTDEGLALWDAWSLKDADRYKEGETRKKWLSFGGRGNPVTMASVIKAAGGVRAGALSVEPASATAATLEDAAADISNMVEYGEFKKRIQAMGAVQIPPDIRSRLATIAHEVFAKDAGMGLREVKSSFRPTKGAAPGVSTDAAMETPDWLVDWVYDEANCLFANRNIGNYAIRREAFRARYDRMPECVGMETDAATLALNMAHIPTVAQTMYWPGMDRLFTSNGRDCLNTFFESGAAPLGVGELAGDEDGMAVVNLFLRHVALLIADEREQGVFLDWLSYVYQNPGKRVHWAMLLWGIEGNGKSYFFNIMQMLMGENTKPISTSMIESRFNDWAVGSTLSCIEEIRISGTNKWAILDTVKPMLTNDTVAVEPKGRASYSAPNFASYLMLTNHQDAIPVSNNDRRYCVIFTAQRCEQDLFDELGGRAGVSDYFTRLFSESRRRVDAIGRWLLDRKQSADFDAEGRAPTTGGLSEMREANVSDDQGALREALSDHACDVVSDTLIDVTHLHTMVTMNEGEALPMGRGLSQMLRDLGYSPVGPRYVKIGDKKHYLWIKSNKITDEVAKNNTRDFHSGLNEFADVPF